MLKLKQQQNIKGFLIFPKMRTLLSHILGVNVCYAIFTDQSSQYLASNEA